jgi:hypothetical protein
MQIDTDTSECDGRKGQNQVKLTTNLGHGRGFSNETGFNGNT